MQAQRVEVIVIGDARIGRRHHLQLRLALGHCGGADGILGVEHQAVQVGQDAKYRLAGPLFQPAQPRFEQGDVAAETVDHKALDPVLLGRREQVQRADQMGKDAAAVDVGNEDHRASTASQARLGVGSRR